MIRERSYENMCVSSIIYEKFLAKVIPMRPLETRREEKNESSSVLRKENQTSNHSLLQKRNHNFILIFLKLKRKGRGY